MYLITYKAGPKWQAGVPMAEQGLRDHFFYLKALDEGGRIALAGPVGEDGGIVLLHTGEKAEADRIMAEDPAVTAGLFVGQARPFTPRFVGNLELEPAQP